MKLNRHLSYFINIFSLYWIEIDSQLQISSRLNFSHSHITSLDSYSFNFPVYVGRLWWNQMNTKFKERFVQYLVDEIKSKMQISNPIDRLQIALIFTSETTTNKNRPKTDSIGIDMHPRQTEIEEEWMLALTLMIIA